MEIMRAQGLTQLAGDRTILDAVSLGIDRAERIAVVGPSGAGKSTLLTLLGGISRPAAGRVLFREAPLDEAGRREIALVLQGYGLVSLLTAEENIEVVLRCGGISPDAARQRAAEALDAVGLTPFASHLIEQLSGGQQQRVAVALALARRPAVLLADEPTAEQDAENRDLVLTRLLAEAATERATALVIATHDQDVADRCDRVVRLADGRLVPP